MTRLVTDLQGSALTDFQGIVRACGGHAWNNNTIDAYMLREKQKYRPNIWWRVNQVDQALVTTLKWGLFACLAVGVIMLFALMVSTIAELANTHLTILDFVTVTNTGMVLGSALACLALWAAIEFFRIDFLTGKVALGHAAWEYVNVHLDDDKIVRLTNPSWVPTDVLDEVPQAVRNLMADIKNELPAATFGISFLARDFLVLDPVLFVTYNGEEVAAMVWDEDGTIVSPPAH